MAQLNLPDKLKNSLDIFCAKLKDIYQGQLISLVLYGSAASGEFSGRNSNLNLLVVLGDAGIENLTKCAATVNKQSIITPLFMTEEYIGNSTDIFPLEFLDMRENYIILHGKDVLKDISIDTKNLRFQCEQELKVKLINLKQLYLKLYNDRISLCGLLFKSFGSVLHLSRNILRLKGKRPAYKKSDVIKELASEFQIDSGIWEKILSAKLGKIKLNKKDTQLLFVSFVRDLEKIIGIVDKL